MNKLRSISHLAHKMVADIVNLIATLWGFWHLNLLDKHKRSENEYFFLSLKERISKRVRNSLLSRQSDLRKRTLIFIRLRVVNAAALFKIIWELIFDTKAIVEYDRWSSNLLSHKNEDISEQLIANKGNLVVWRLIYYT